MNKAKLIEKIAESADLRKGSASRALEVILKVISDELASGGSVSVTGFGTFSVKERAARTGRNPQTGETIQIAAAKLPGFKAGKQLKDACN